MSAIGVTAAPVPASRTAWLFPGQGAEASGALRVRPGPVTRLLDRAGRTLGLDLARAVARGEPCLARTEVAQPALVAVSLGIAEEQQARGGGPDAVAGHSLGELSAVAAAGCLSAEEAVDLAIERGRLMGEAARDNPGAMAAVRVEQPHALERLLALARRHGRVAIAARNSPTQWILAGERIALQALALAAPIVFLPTGGAWHSDAMAAAESRWLAPLRAARLRRPRRPLVLNRTGREVRSDDDLPALLAGQLTRPIEWTETLRTLEGLGVTRFLVLGPGKVLRALCRETLGANCDVVLATGGSS